MGHSYVYRQPITAKEKTVVFETMRACPVEAIGCSVPVEQTDECSDSESSIGLFNAVAIA